MDEEKKNRIDDSEHHYQCPECGEWFDLRDLAAVFAHEHWMEVKPIVSFSHVKLLGKEEEVYVKVRNKMLTLKLEKPR